MKDRATIVCRKRGHILLVARERGRWALPGGTVKRGETPIQAAERELLEETAIAGGPLLYLFEFGGINKRHHVFLFETHDDVEPVASREIVRCRWFLQTKVSSLLTSVPTREIVALLRTRALPASSPGSETPGIIQAAWEATCP